METNILSHVHPSRKRFPRPKPDEWLIDQKCPIYGRLVALAKNQEDPNHRDNDQLLKTIEKLIKEAADLASKPNPAFEQYTNHSNIHFKNVLWWMGLLAGDSVEKWHALECAVAISAAFAHDLGMVVLEPERAMLNKHDDPTRVSVGDSGNQSKLDEEMLKYAARWRSYRAGDKKWLDYLAGKKADERLYEVTKTNYLRLTHADTKFTGGESRIEHNLRQLLEIRPDEERPALFEYCGANWLKALINVCHSHGQEIGYVRQMLTAADSPYTFLRNAGNDKLTKWPGSKVRVHWERLEWLLRLADIMDLDATRTPRVQFWDITDPISIEEWEKHMAVGRIYSDECDTNPDIWRIVYEVPNCHSVSVEKALYKMAYCTPHSSSAPPSGWINEELRKVRRAAVEYQGLFPGQNLDLPTEAHIDVIQQRGYEWRDLAFHLDHQSVSGLLMGEALYDKPTDALRELVQNALDAVHLKDLRGKLYNATRDTFKPQPLVKQEVYDHDLNRLAVKVKWGKVDFPNAKSGRAVSRDYIEVEDNGVGMSKQILENYLSRVGQSFYNSPEYFRERHAMRSFGFVPTPISQFGIGFLAVFMLADEIEIFTRCHGDKPGKQTVVKVHGQKAAWSINTESVNRGVDEKATFTRVRLWLKESFQLAEFNMENFLTSIRYKFYPSDSQKNAPPDIRKKIGNKKIEIDPAEALAECIVWPQYPVELYPPLGKNDPSGEQPKVVLDDKFHHRELLNKVVAKVKTLPGLQNAGLSSIDWTDGFEKNLDGELRLNGLEIPTGSRIRLTRFVENQKDDVSHSMADADFSPGGCFTKESVLTRTANHVPSKGRFLILCNGILLPNWDELLDYADINPGVGSLLWLDLRGAAAPRLKADRSKISAHQDPFPGTPMSRKEAAQAMQTRWVEAMAHEDRIWKRTAISLRNEKLNWKGEDAITWKPPASHFKENELDQWVKTMIKSWIQESVTNNASWLSVHSDNRRFAVLGKPVPRDLRITAEALELFKREAHNMPHDGSAANDTKGLILRTFLECEINKEGEKLAGLIDLSITKWQELSGIFQKAFIIRRALANTADESTRQLISAWSFFVETHHFSACFFPTLDKSLAALGAYGLPGALSQLSHKLLGPLLLGVGKTREDTDQWLNSKGIDFVAPLTALPVGKLGWGDIPDGWDARVHRHVLLLPFYLGKVPSCLSPEAIASKFNLTSVSLYVPGIAALGRTWKAIMEAEKVIEDRRSENVEGKTEPLLAPEELQKFQGVTMMWNLQTGILTWEQGMCSKGDMEFKGKPWPELQSAGPQPA